MSSGGRDTHRPEERLLNLLGEDVEHFNRLCGQGQIGAGHPLILSQLRLPTLLLLLKVCKSTNTIILFGVTFLALQKYE